MSVDTRRNPDAAVQIFGDSVVPDDSGPATSLWFRLVGLSADRKALFPGPFLESPTTLQVAKHNRAWRFDDDTVRIIGERTLVALYKSSGFSHDKTFDELNTDENLIEKERDSAGKFGLPSTTELIKSGVRLVEVVQWREGDDNLTHVFATHKSVTDNGDADYRMLWEPIAKLPNATEEQLGEAVVSAFVESKHSFRELPSHV